MIESAAAANGIAFGRAQSRCCLARVEDLRARSRGVHRLGRERGRPAQTLQPVERCPFRPQQGVKLPANDRDLLAGRDSVAVADLRQEADIGVERSERRKGEIESADDTVGSGDEVGVALPPVDPLTQ